LLPPGESAARPIKARKRRDRQTVTLRLPLKATIVINNNNIDINDGVNVYGAGTAIARVRMHAEYDKIISYVP